MSPWRGEADPWCLRAVPSASSCLMGRILHQIALELHQLSSISPWHPASVVLQKAPDPADLLAMKTEVTAHSLPPASSVEPPSEATLAPLMTIRQVAEYLAVCELTVRRLVRTGQLPCVRVGVQLRFQPRDLLRWISARKEGR